MTRIFLYLLALVGGFSAAEAARPVSAQPAELGAPAAMAAVVAASYAVAAQSLDIPHAQPSVRNIADQPILVRLAFVADTPVSRNDRSRE